ncbi:MAG: glycoside hydrolase family 15 protein [Gammaproteobacteria bacterium]|jgi:GH15 family glucan-1,4-alpha-glucosidase|nr:glycoside hydrolase family 15 protein [Gammaproteobacteria bacterium]
MSNRPISDYALISDRHGAGLVARDGSIDWLCLPRFDAPAQLSGLLGADCGHFRIGPRADRQVEIRRRYLPETLVLETLFDCPEGQVVLRDALATGEEEQTDHLGRGAPHIVLRTLHCSAGRVAIEVDYAPRPEYGLIRPLLEPVAGGIATRGGASILRLSTDAQMKVEDCSARARFELRAGDRVGFALQHGSTAAGLPEAITPETIPSRLKQTIDDWRAWSGAHQAYEGPWSELVRHSGRVLYGLSYEPTGAIIAAPTTSLATCIGGGRNWDYRYSWVRDASLTLEALWVAACPTEAHRFFDFLGATALIQVREHGNLQVLFGIEGEHDLSERELPHLPGWRDSAPVRVGNAAWSQRQLDVYGEVMTAAYRVREQLQGLGDAGRRFLTEIADAAAARWQELDHGIWEMRTPPRHYLHSKLMCWAALDRAIAMAAELGAEHRLSAWRAAQAEIRNAILERGWSDAVGAYTQTFGGEDLDAAALMMPIVGFLPADDPRVLATMDAIEAHLTDDQGFVYRYLADDGLAGGEGPFLICTFWLAQARAQAGQIDRARALFERAAGCANDVGLLSEQVAPNGGELLGNFPQAFSHIGLVNAAHAIEQAERAKEGQRIE